MYFCIILSINSPLRPRPRARLLPVVGKVLQILVYRVDRLIDVVRLRVVRVHVDPLGKVRRNRVRHVRPQEALQKLAHQLPAAGGYQARPILDLHQDALKVLAHRHAAQLDEEVSKLEPWPLRFDLGLLLRGVNR